MASRPTYVFGLQGVFCVLDDLTKDDTVRTVKVKIETLAHVSADFLVLGTHETIDCHDDDKLRAYGWMEGDHIYAAQASKGRISDEELASKQRQSSLPPGEYGYLQIDDYRSKSNKIIKTGESPGPRRWVPLPADTDVHRFLGDSRRIQFEVSRPHHSNDGCKGQRPSDVRANLLSCLKQRSKKAEDGSFSARSTNSESTVASASDSIFCRGYRRVCFADGLMPGCEESVRGYTIRRTFADMMIAEWIYIDRFICGVSVHEFRGDPTATIRDPNLGQSNVDNFYSAPHGRDFKMDLEDLWIQCAFEQGDAAACPYHRERYAEELLDLNIPLSLAEHNARWNVHAQNERNPFADAE